MLTFFCYCALEQTAGLWGSSYLVSHNGVPAAETASPAALFFIGIQMASAYVGTCIMPPLCGITAQYVGISLFPFFLLLLLWIMVLMHERTVRKTKEPQTVLCR